MKEPNMEDVELLPCPFCGGKAEIVKNRFPPKNPWRHPSCKNNNCPGFVEEQDEQGGTNCDYRTDKDAINAWNTRIPRTKAVMSAKELLAGIRNNLYNRSHVSERFGCRIIPEEDFEAMADAIYRFIHNAQKEKIGE